MRFWKITSLLFIVLTLAYCTDNLYELLEVTEHATS